VASDDFTWVDTTVGTVDDTLLGSQHPPRGLAAMLPPLAPARRYPSGEHGQTSPTGGTRWPTRKRFLCLLLDPVLTARSLKLPNSTIFTSSSFGIDVVGPAAGDTSVARVGNHASALTVTEVARATNGGRGARVFRGPSGTSVGLGHGGNDV